MSICLKVSEEQGTALLFEDPDSVIPRCGCNVAVSTPAHVVYGARVKPAHCALARVLGGLVGSC